MMTHEETIDFLATYALDAVDGEERAQIEEHLAQCPRCRTELDAFREVATALGNSVEPLPEGLWSSIASRLPERHDEARPPMPRLVRSEDAADRTAAAPARSRLGRGTLAVGAAVAAVAAVVAILGVSLIHADSQVSQFEHNDAGTVPSAVVSALETPGHQVVNLEGPQHGGTGRVAQFVLADGRGYLVSSSLPTLSSDHTYQLWGVVNGQPISLGLLGQSPTHATFTLAGSPSASKLGITVEPAGGSVVPTRSMYAQGTV
jgi:anti-sigma factor RsiW